MTNLLSPADHVTALAVTLHQPLLPIESIIAAHDAMKRLAITDPRWVLAFAAKALHGLACGLPADDPWRNLAATDGWDRLVSRGCPDLPTTEGQVAVWTREGMPFDAGIGDAMDLVPRTDALDLINPAVAPFVANTVPAAVPLIAFAGFSAETVFRGLQTIVRGLGEIAPGAASGVAWLAALDAMLRLIARRQQYVGQGDTYTFDVLLTAAAATDALRDDRDDDSLWVQMVQTAPHPRGHAHKVAELAGEVGTP